MTKKEKAITIILLSCALFSLGAVTGMYIKNLVIKEWEQTNEYQRRITDNYWGQIQDLTLEIEVLRGEN